MPTAPLLGSFLRALGVALIVAVIVVGESVMQGQRLSSEIPVVTLVVAGYVLLLTSQNRSAATRRLRGEILTNDPRWESKP